MLKKSALIIIGIILLLMVSVFFLAKDITISVSEIEAQTAIDEFLASSNPETMGVQISPTFVKIDFKDGNRAQINSKITLDGHGYTGRFDGTFSTGIDCRVPRLHLDELQLLEGGFQTDDQSKTELSELKNAAINVLHRKRKSLQRKSLKIPPVSQVKTSWRNSSSRQ